MLNNAQTGGEPLSFKVDWGGANLVRAGGWLSQWVCEQTPDHRQSVLLTERGMGDNLASLAKGEVDVALATPASFAGLALEGTGPFKGRGIPELVAIGALPHRDAMIPVAKREFGFTSHTDVAAYEGPLRVSLGSGDQDGFMGFGAEVVLAAGGIDLEEIVARGGQVTRHEQPFDAIADLRQGRADLMISEAIMTPDWQDLGQDGGVTFLSLCGAEADAIETLFRRSTSPAKSNPWAPLTTPIGPSRPPVAFLTAPPPYWPGRSWNMARNLSAGIATGLRTISRFAIPSITSWRGTLASTCIPQLRLYMNWQTKRKRS